MTYTILIGCAIATWAFISQLGAAEQKRKDAERPVPSGPDGSHA